MQYFQFENQGLNDFECFGMETLVWNSRHKVMENAIPQPAGGDPLLEPPMCHKIVQLPFLISWFVCFARHTFDPVGSWNWLDSIPQWQSHTKRANKNKPQPRQTGKAANNALKHLKTNELMRPALHSDSDIFWLWIVTEEMGREETSLQFHPQQVPGRLLIMNKFEPATGSNSDSKIF